MPIDPAAVGVTTTPVELSWTEKDCLLYALGVGAGAADPAAELEFTTENSLGLELRALPTFAVVVGLEPALDALGRIGPFDWSQLVHGDQQIVWHRPLPPSGVVQAAATVTGIYDKGSGAVVVTELVAEEGSGAPLFTLRSGVFIRGEGGWGGDRGPAAPAGPPDRAPDYQVTYATTPNQALLYRLSGDRNPLHSDPTFAAKGGFARPILHGLCTLGFAGRALLHTFCGSDPGRAADLSARFSGPVTPGDELTVSMWTVGPGRASFQVATGAGTLVLTAGHFGYRAAGG